MKEFRDAKDRTWQLSINCDVLETVKEACGVNLLDLADPASNLLQEIGAFPPLLAKFLYAALADQARTKEVDEREFRRSLSGDVLAAATDALLEELVLFFPKHRRELLQAVLEQNKQVEEAGTALALAKLADPEVRTAALAALDRKVTAQIRTALDKIDADEASATSSSTAAGGPPASSASQTVPDHTPGDDSSGSPPAAGNPGVG